MSEQGATATEFAVVYSLLLVLVLAVVHFGIVFHAGLAVADAADAALEALQAEGGTAADADAAARYVLGGDRTVRSVAISVSSDSENAVVRVSAEAPSLVPGLPTVVSRTSGGPIERFIAEPER